MLTIHGISVICNKSIFKYEDTIECDIKFLNVIQKLEDNIVINPENNCWEYQKYLDKDGYGETKINYKSMKVHRALYMLCIGELFPGEVVRHTCDNPNCSNPAHLLKGTPKQNTADMILKDRSRSKITIADLPNIIELREGGMLQKDIGLIYGVTDATISRILRGDTFSEHTRKTMRYKKIGKSYPQGENFHGSKLNTQQVIEIRRKHFIDNVSYPKLAKEYNMSPTGIQGICRGTTWKSVPFEDYANLKSTLSQPQSILTQK